MLPTVSVPMLSARQMNKKSIVALSVILAVLVIDQAIKIWIKTHMMLGDEFSVCGDWFYIHFVENNGMAFGMEMGGSWGKLLLSLFRIVAVAAIAVYLVRLCRRESKMSLVACIALVWAGAVGNIVDSLLYGVMFDSSWGQVATLFPEAGGYSSIFHGRVVDMFYFPLIETTWPQWVPVVGGDSFVFFRPVFNFADAAISVGVVLLLLFHRNDLSLEFNKEKK